MVDREVVLALLEERPYLSAEIAELLEQPHAVVHGDLLAMRRAGLLKRVGATQAWALPAHVAAAGRKPQNDRAACRAAILAALAAGRAARLEVIVANVGYSRNVVKHECGLMLAKGELARHGNGRASRWTLPDYVPAAAGFATSKERKKTAAPRPAVTTTRQTPSTTVHEQATSSVRRDEGTSKELLGEGGARLYPKDQIDAMLDDEDEDLVTDVDDAPADADIDEDLDELEEPAPTPRRARKSKSAPLRQAPVTTTSAEPSWWVGKDREAFTAAAREHEPRLMHSKTALRMTVRTLP